MSSDGRLKDLLPVPLQSGKRARLVGCHQPRIADDIGREDGSQFPVDASFGHESSEASHPKIEHAGT